MSMILSLPKDLLGVIFSFLWRIEAKGIPLTCKLFHFILVSPRWFKGWKMFQAHIESELCIECKPPAKKLFVEYDHFDTFKILLARVQKLNQSQIHSFFTIKNKKIELFHENDFVFNFQNQTFYGSKYTWSESRNMQQIFFFGFSEDVFPWLNVLM
jgi:hypothetical protein